MIHAGTLRREQASTSAQPPQNWPRQRRWREGADFLRGPTFSGGLLYTISGGAGLAQIDAEPEASMIARIIAGIRKLTGRQERLDRWWMCWCPIAVSLRLTMSMCPNQSCTTDLHLCFAVLRNSSICVKGTIPRKKTLPASVPIEKLITDVSFAARSLSLWIFRQFSEFDYFQKVGRGNIRTVGFDADSQRKEPRAGSGSSVDRACSAVVIALRFVTQGPGFEPGLFHKACGMPLHGWWMKLRVFLGVLLTESAGLSVRPICWWETFVAITAGRWHDENVTSSARIHWINDKWQSEAGHNQAGDTKRTVSQHVGSLCYHSQTTESQGARMIHVTVGKFQFPK